MKHLEKLNNWCNDYRSENGAWPSAPEIQVKITLLMAEATVEDGTPIKGEEKHIGIHIDDFETHIDAKHAYIKSRYALFLIENKYSSKFIAACDELGIFKSTRNAIENLCYDMDLRTMTALDSLHEVKFWDTVNIYDKN